MLAALIALFLASAAIFLFAVFIRRKLIRGEATATRELFNATEAARLRDALADAKSEVSQQGLIGRGHDHPRREGRGMTTDGGDN